MNQFRVSNLRWDTTRLRLAGTFENSVEGTIIRFGRRLDQFKERI